MLKMTSSNQFLSVWSASAAVVLSLFFNPTQAADVDFKRDIAPILEERCWGCHSEDEAESGLRLDFRPRMLKGGDSGLATVVPGKPEKSYLIEVINHVDEDMAMPPDEDKLPGKEIELLTQWIKDGAVWPGQMDAVLDETSDHWSFQAVKRPKVPEPTALASGSSARPNETQPAASAVGSQRPAPL